jgi:hypothetical protein
MLFGGLLPPGAVSVDAVEATGVRKVAAVGCGTYAVIFEDGEHSEPALGYRDPAGAFVHRPMPAEYRHQPVTDAGELCPVLRDGPVRGVLPDRGLARRSRT